MYTTKILHPKIAKSYISIGDPYGIKQPVDDRFKKQQFKIVVPKKGQMNDSYFGFYKYPEGKENSEGMPTVIRYLEREPRDKRHDGFGSKDASRTDEFTNHTRVIQWKEALEREMQFASTWAHKNEEKIKAGSAEVKSHSDQADRVKDQTAIMHRKAEIPHLFQTKVPETLYDIGKEGGVTPICNKCERETFYCSHRVGRGSVTARRVGPVFCESLLYGSGMQDVIKPRHGRRSHTKDFLDQAHLGGEEKAFSYTH